MHNKCPFRSFKSSRINRVISALTLFCFFLQTIAFSAPEFIQTAPLSPEMKMAGPDFEIPDELGHIEKVHISRQSAGLIVHIQDAHGNYEAQKNIAGIIRHLSERHQVQLLLLEGANEKLDPGYFHFFEDQRLNLKVADILMRHGQFTGSEMLLLEREKSRLPQIQGLGVEETDLYRRDLELFRAVHGSADLSRDFLGRLKESLRVLESRIFSGDLLELAREWRKHENEGALLRYVDFAAGQAARRLALDLKNPLYQDAYPSVVRILKLKEIESRLDARKIQKERDELKAFLQGKVSAELLSALAALDPEAGQASPRRENPRFILEKIYQEAGSKGLDFKRFPNFSLFAAYAVLQQEIESPKLYAELTELTDRLFAALARTDQERELVRLIKDEGLLSKLFHLELSREEFETIDLKKEGLAPGAVFARIRALESAAATAAEKKKIRPPVTEENPASAALFDQALEFYRLALEREKSFMASAGRAMKRENLERAVLVTGGFHAEGMENQIIGRGLSYVRVSPRIGTVDRSQEVYLAAMMGKTRIEPTAYQAQDAGSSSIMLAAHLESEPGQEALMGPDDAARRKAVTGEVVRGVLKAAALGEESLIPEIRRFSEERRRGIQAELKTIARRLGELRDEQEDLAERELRANQQEIRDLSLRREKLIQERRSLARQARTQEAASLGREKAGIILSQSELIEELTGKGSFQGAVSGGSRGHFNILARVVGNQVVALEEYLTHSGGVAEQSALMAVVRPWDGKNYFAKPVAMQTLPLDRFGARVNRIYMEGPALVERMAAALQANRPLPQVLEIAAASLGGEKIGRRRMIGDALKLVGAAVMGGAMCGTGCGSGSVVQGAIEEGITSPDGRYNVRSEGDSLVVMADGRELGRVRVSAQQVSLVSFNATNEGTYFVMNQRGNAAIGYAAYAHLEKTESVSLPEGIAARSPQDIVLAPGEPRAKVKDTRQFEYEVDLAKRAVVVGGGEAKVSPDGRHEVIQTGNYFYILDRPIGRSLQIVAVPGAAGIVRIESWRALNDRLEINISQRDNPPATYRIPYGGEPDPYLPHVNMVDIAIITEAASLGEEAYVPQKREVLLFDTGYDLAARHALDTTGVYVPPTPRSADDVYALLDYAQKEGLVLEIEAHLRGVDGPGSSLDLPEFQLKLTRRGVKNIPDIPSTPTLASMFSVKIRFEKAADPNVIEYIAPDYGIKASAPYRVRVADEQGKVQGVRLVEKMRDGKRVMQTPKGEKDAPAFVFANIFGLRGVRIILDEMPPMALAGGMESSNAFNVALYMAGSMLSGQNWSLADIFARSVEDENTVFGGLTGGQGHLSSILGGAYRHTWLSGIKSTWKSILKEILRFLLGWLIDVDRWIDEYVNHYAAFSEPLLAPEQVERLAGHMALVQAGKTYERKEDGSWGPKDSRSAGAINDIWTALLRKRDKVGVALHFQKLRLAAIYTEELKKAATAATEDEKRRALEKVVEMVNRYVDTRVALLERWDELARQGKVQPRDANTDYLGPARELILKAREYGIAIMPLGAGGPGANNVAIGPDREVLERFLKDQGLDEVDADKAEEMREAIRGEAADGTPLSGERTVKGYMPFQMSSQPVRATEDWAKLKIVPPAPPLKIIYDEATGKFENLPAASSLGDLREARRQADLLEAKEKLKGEAAELKGDIKDHFSGLTVQEILSEGYYWSLVPSDFEKLLARKLKKGPLSLEEAIALASTREILEELMLSAVRAVLKKFGIVEYDSDDQVSDAYSYKRPNGRYAGLRRLSYDEALADIGVFAGQLAEIKASAKDSPDLTREELRLLKSTPNLREAGRLQDLSAGRARAQQEYARLFDGRPESRRGKFEKAIRKADSAEKVEQILLEEVKGALHELGIVEYETEDQVGYDYYYDDPVTGDTVVLDRVGYDDAAADFLAFREELAALNRKLAKGQSLGALNVRFSGRVLQVAKSETAGTAAARELLSVKPFYVFEVKLASELEAKLAGYMKRDQVRVAQAVDEGYHDQFWAQLRSEIKSLAKQIKTLEGQPDSAGELAGLKRELADKRSQIETLVQSGKSPPHLLLVPLEKMAAMEAGLSQKDYVGPVAGDNVFAIHEDAPESKGAGQLDSVPATDYIRISTATLSRLIVQVDGVPHYLLMLMDKKLKESGEARYIPVGGGLQYKKGAALRDSPFRKELEARGAREFEGDKKGEPDLRFQIPRGQLDWLLEEIAKQDPAKIEDPTEGLIRELVEELTGVEADGRPVFTEAELLGEAASVGEAKPNFADLRKALLAEMEAGDVAFAMVKPDGISVKDEIIQYLREQGFEVFEGAPIRIDTARAEDFYAEHLGKTFFPYLVEYITSAPVVPLLLRRPGGEAVKHVRAIIKGLREKFGIEQRPNITLNKLHAGDSVASAVRESGIAAASASSMGENLVKTHDVRDDLIARLRELLGEGYSLYPGGYSSIDIAQAGMNKRAAILDLVAYGNFKSGIYFGDEFYQTKRKTGNDTPVLAAKHEIEAAGKKLTLFSVDKDPEARMEEAKVNTIWIGAGPEATRRVLAQIIAAAEAGESEVTIAGQGPDAHKSAVIRVRELIQSGFLGFDVDGTLFDVKLNQKLANFNNQDATRDLFRRALQSGMHAALISGNSKTEQRKRVSDGLKAVTEISKLIMYMNGGATRLTFDAAGNETARNLSGDIPAADVEKVARFIRDEASRNFGLTDEEIDGWMIWFRYDGEVVRRPDFPNMEFVPWIAAPDFAPDILSSDLIRAAPEQAEPVRSTEPFVENRDNVQLSVKILPAWVYIPRESVRASNEFSEFRVAPGATAIHDVWSVMGSESITVNQSLDDSAPDMVPQPDGLFAFNTSTGEILTLQRQEGPLAYRAVAVSRDGDWLAAMTADGKITVWDFPYLLRTGSAEGAAEARFDGAVNIDALAIGPDSKQLTAKAEGREIAVYSMPPSLPERLTRLLDLFENVVAGADGARERRAEIDEEITRLSNRGEKLLALIEKESGEAGMIRKYSPKTALPIFIILHRIAHLHYQNPAVVDKAIELAARLPRPDVVRDEIEALLVEMREQRPPAQSLGALVRKVRNIGAMAMVLYSPFQALGGLIPGASAKSSSSAKRQAHGAFGSLEALETRTLLNGADLFERPDFVYQPELYPAAEVGVMTPGPKAEGESAPAQTARAAAAQEAIVSPDGKTSFRLTGPTREEPALVQITDRASGEIIFYRQPFLLGASGMQSYAFSPDGNWLLLADRQAFVYAFHLQDGTRPVRGFQTAGLDPAFLSGMQRPQSGYVINSMEFINSREIRAVLANGDVETFYLSKDEFRHARGPVTVSASSPVEKNQVTPFPVAFRTETASAQRVEETGTGLKFTYESGSSGAKLVFKFDQPVDLSRAPFKLGLQGDPDQIIITVIGYAEGQLGTIGALYLSDIQSEDGFGAVIDFSKIAGQGKGVDIKNVREIRITVGSAHDGGGSGIASEKGSLYLHFKPVSGTPAEVASTVSNANFTYRQRFIPGSSQGTVYDIFGPDGFISSVSKQSANIRGFYTAAAGVPDASPDGKFVVAGQMAQSFYTGHVLKRQWLAVIDSVTGETARTIRLNEIDNRDFTAEEAVAEVRFKPGSSHIIQVSFRSGAKKFFNAQTGQEMTQNAVPTPSNPAFSYEERYVPGSSTSRVFDIFKPDGSLLTTLTKLQSVGPSSLKAIGAPDVSPDGKHLSLIQEQRSLYTGHDQHEILLHLLNAETGAPERTLRLIAYENRELPANERPVGARFREGSSEFIQVIYADGHADEFHVPQRTTAEDGDIVLGDISNLPILTTGNGDRAALLTIKEPGSSTLAEALSDQFVFTRSAVDEGVGVVFDDFSDSEIQTADLSAAPFDRIRLYLSGTRPTAAIQVISVDPDTGAETKREVLAEGLTQQRMKRVTLDMNALAEQGLDRRHIRAILVLNPETGVASYLLKTTRQAAPGLPQYTLSSNPNFIFREVPRVTVASNVDLYLIDMRDPSREILVGGGSAIRFNPYRYDISPDGKIVVAAYLESGPVLGSLSQIQFYRTEDLLAGNRRPAHVIPTAIANQIRFEGRNIIVDATVRAPSYATDYATERRIFTVPMSQFDLPALPAGYVRAASNPNFAFKTAPDQSGLNRSLFMVDLSNPAQEILVGGGSQIRHNPERFDVSPDGQIVVAGFVEHGPVLGQLSQIKLYRTSDLKAGNQTPSQVIGEAVANQIRFEGRNLIIQATVRASSYPVDNATQLKTFVISMDDVLNPAVPAGHGPGSIRQTGETFVVTAGDGTRLGPANQEAQVEVRVPQGWPARAFDRTGISPLIARIQAPYGQEFVTIRNGERASFLVGLPKQFRIGLEQSEDVIPDFVLINGRVVPVTARLAGYNPLGWRYFNVEFSVSGLKNDGTDVIDVMSIHTHALQPGPHLLFSRSYVSADRTVWAAFGRPGANGVPTHVNFITPAGTRTYETRLLENEPVLSARFDAPGQNFIIRTASRTVTIDVQTGTIDNDRQYSPNGLYSVEYNNGYLIATYPDGHTQQVRVAGGVAYLRGFRPTNSGVYFHGDQRGNLYFQFVPFNQFDQKHVINAPLPAQPPVQRYGGSIQFVPGTQEPLIWARLYSLQRELVRLPEHPLTGNPSIIRHPAVRLEETVRDIPPDQALNVPPGSPGSSGLFVTRGGDRLQVYQVGGNRVLQVKTSTGRTLHFRLAPGRQWSQLQMDYNGDLTVIYSGERSSVVYIYNQATNRLGAIDVSPVAFSSDEGQNASFTADTVAISTTFPARNQIEIVQGDGDVYRISLVQERILESRTSPNGAYRVDHVRGYLVLRDNRTGREIGRVNIETTSGHPVVSLQGYRVTNRGVYADVDQRSNPLIQFAPFSDFQALRNVPLPAAVANKGIQDLRFGHPTRPILDVRGNDFVIRRVDLETGAVDDVAFAQIGLGQIPTRDGDGVVELHYDGSWIQPTNPRIGVRLDFVAPLNLKGQSLTLNVSATDHRVGAAVLKEIWLRVEDVRGKAIEFPLKKFLQKNGTVAIPESFLKAQGLDTRFIQRVDVFIKNKGLQGVLRVRTDHLTRPESTRPAAEVLSRFIPAALLEAARKRPVFGNPANQSWAQQIDAVFSQPPLMWANETRVGTLDSPLYDRSGTSSSRILEPLPQIEFKARIGKTPGTARYFYEKTPEGVIHRVVFRDEKGAEIVLLREKAPVGAAPFIRLKIEGGKLIITKKEAGEEKTVEIPIDEKILESLSRAEEVFHLDGEQLLAMLLAGMIVPGAERRQDRKADASSLGLQTPSSKVVSEEQIYQQALAYSAEQGRSRPDAILRVADDVTLDIYYLEGAQAAVLQYYRDKLGLTESADAVEAQTDLERAMRDGTFKAEDVLDYLAIRPETQRMPVVAFVNELFGNRIEKWAERDVAQAAAKIARSLNPGDVFLGVVSGEGDRRLMARLYREAAPRRFRAKAVPQELISDSMLRSLTRSAEAAPLVMSGLDEAGDSRLALNGMVRVRFNAKVLRDAGIDLGWAVGLLRQIADNPENFAKLNLRQDREGYWEVGSDFAALMEKVFTELKAQERIDIAA